MSKTGPKIGKLSKNGTDGGADPAPERALSVEGVASVEERSNESQRN